MSKFDTIVCKKDEVQDININQIKLEVHDTYEEDKKTTNFEPSDDVDVVNKIYLDEKLSKTNGHISLLERKYNEFKLQYNKQFVEEILIQKAVETTIQILRDNSLFDSFSNADKVSKDSMFVP